GGAYHFSNLRPSSPFGYTLTQTVEPPNTLNGKVTVGTPGGTSGNDVIFNIVLNAGVNGVNNNFGEILASTAGLPHAILGVTASTPQVFPDFVSKSEVFSSADMMGITAFVNRLY